MSLKDAISAIIEKIKIAADSASAEELAYLATALERIGGKASVSELDELATSHKQSIFDGLNEAEAAAIAGVAEKTSDGLAALNAVINVGVTATTAGINAITTGQDSALSAVLAKQESGVALVVAAQATGIASLVSAAQAALEQSLGQRGRLMFYSTF